MTLYSNSNMDEKLSNSLLVDDVQYCIYGDPACMLRSHLQVEFPALNAALT
jgi:hypothetical protein